MGFTDLSVRIKRLNSGHKMLHAFMTSSTSLYLLRDSKSAFRIIIYGLKGGRYANLSGNHSIVAPPDPIPNSAVKRNRADGSLGSPHARVGHFQAPNLLERVVKQPAII
jgi:hypothetical protein